jgi:hypothetical protein
MGWTIILEDENNVEIESVNKELFIKKTNNNDFKLIKYLDPYGDTIFNNLQMKDIIADMEIIAKMEPNNKLIDEIILLAKRCMNEPHLYLVFYGD